MVQLCPWRLTGEEGTVNRTYYHAEKAVCIVEANLQFHKHYLKTVTFVTFFTFFKDVLESQSGQTRINISITITAYRIASEIIRLKV